MQGDSFPSHVGRVVLPYRCAFPQSTLSFTVVPLRSDRAAILPCSRLLAWKGKPYVVRKSRARHVRPAGLEPRDCSHASFPPPTKVGRCWVAQPRTPSMRPVILHRGVQREPSSCTPSHASIRGPGGRRPEQCECLQQLGRRSPWDFQRRRTECPTRGG